MKHRSQPPQALLFLCHRTEKGFIDRYKALATSFSRYGEAYFVFDSTANPLPEHLKCLRHFEFSSHSLKALGYKWLQDSLMPGHVHFPVLEFALKHPNYSHYWVVEYDVRFTGPWRLFFWLARRTAADFIATHLSHYNEQPFWYWWPTYSNPDKDHDVSSCVRFFGPLYRISRAAVEFVDAQLKAGCQGHQEVVIPSLLHEAGFSLMDLSRSGSFRGLSPWSLYTRSNRDVWGALVYSSMRFRPPMDFSGIRPFTFYHPIKDPYYGYPAFLKYLHRITYGRGNQTRGKAK